MLKGVTKRIVEIKSPQNPAFERAVLYLRSDLPAPKNKRVLELAEDYLEDIGPEKSDEKGKDLRLIVAVLALSLGVTLTAFLILLFLYTKM